MRLSHILPVILGMTIAAVPGVIAGAPNTDARFISVRPSCMDKPHPSASCMQKWQIHLWCVANPKPCTEKHPWLSEHLQALEPVHRHKHGHGHKHGKHGEGPHSPAAHGKPSVVIPRPSPSPSSSAPAAGNNAPLNVPSLGQIQKAENSGRGVMYNGASYDASMVTGAIDGVYELLARRGAELEEDLGLGENDEDGFDKDMDMTLSSLHEKSKLVARSNLSRKAQLASCLTKRLLSSGCALAWLRIQYCCTEQTKCKAWKPRLYKALFGEKAPKPDMVPTSKEVEKNLEKGNMGFLKQWTDQAPPYPENYGFNKFMDIWKPGQPGVRPHGGLGPVVHTGGQAATHPIFPRGEGLDVGSYAKELEENDGSEEAPESSPATLSRRNTVDEEEIDSDDENSGQDEEKHSSPRAQL